MSSVIAAVIIFGIVKAEKDNSTCAISITKYSTCSFNDTDCKISFEVGNCISCDFSLCKLVTATCLIDLEMNSSFNIDLKTGMIYSNSLPNSCQDLESKMCGGMNRVGHFCRQCKPGYGLAPYSGSVKCFKCTDNNSIKLWVLYLMLELIPSTGFFLVVILFNVRTTTPPFTAFVFFSQFFALLYKINPYIRLSLNLRVNKVLLHCVLTLISFWNLDFFRYAVPQFCISSKLTDLDVLLLECISAYYPLLLVILTFVLIELHARNFLPLVILWKPFHKCFATCQRKLDPKSSVIAAFATFMSLSFSKILAIAFLVALSGSSSSHSHPITYRGLYDPSIKGNTTAEYFKQLVHKPYFVPLLFMAVFVQLPALLLLFYPIKAFRKLITCCGSSVHHAVYVFMDTFQGHYKMALLAVGTIEQYLALVFCLELYSF